MALFYNPVRRQKPNDPGAPMKWYLILKSLGMITEKEVAAAISDETTLNPKEAEMALYQLKKVVLANLLNGKTVQLGELGSLHLTVNSEGVDSEEEVNPNLVKKINIRFSPSEQLKEAVAKASFKPAKSISKQEGG